MTNHSNIDQDNDFAAKVDEDDDDDNASDDFTPGSSLSIKNRFS